MGLKIYGILSAQSPDRVGETILLDGIDTTRLVGIRDEHEKDDFFHNRSKKKAPKNIGALKKKKISNLRFVLNNLLS
jgi:hypothetical protein